MREDDTRPKRTSGQRDVSVSGDTARAQSDGRPSRGLPLTAEATPTDHRLVGQCRDGDQNAATQLYTRYARRLTALVRRRCSAQLARAAGVEDIVQSVFKTLFQRIGQGYYDIPDGEELWKLLLVITLNKIRAKATYVNAVKRDSRRSTDGALARQRAEWIESAQVAAAEHADLVLEEILDRLPGQHRFMLRLRIDGHTVAEIASLTGRPLRSVERVLQETRSMLRDLLPEES